MIAGGPSVNDYPRREIETLCKYGFVFAVIKSVFDFPCDVIVALDFIFITNNIERLKKLNKPIITRQWENFEQFGLDLTMIPQEFIYTYPNSGMLACKLSDAMSRVVGKKSYVLGMDNTGGHYYDNGKAPENGYDGINGQKVVNSYENLKLNDTINLSVRSKISCWPKQSKLPVIKKILVHTPYRGIGASWIKTYANRIVKDMPLT
ncbi:MAG: hypothetical protein WC648_05185 [Candidatus Paceibacterota bacterium]